MLTKFSIKNFKNFETKFSIDFTQTKQYNFSTDCVKDGIVKTGLIYGPNSIGKTNLGKAIFDIVQTVTNKEKCPNLYICYQNARHSDDVVSFSYEFHFAQGTARYEYDKFTYEDILIERFFVNNKPVVVREGPSFESVLAGTESLNKSNLSSKISAMRFIRANSTLTQNNENSVVLNFFDFADRMLTFWNLKNNVYQGYLIGTTQVGDEIIKMGKLPELEAFLNSVDVDCKLTSMEINGQKKMFFNFDGSLIDFWDNASTGTVSLVHFFFWYLQLKKSPETAPSFMYFDEFNAFFHEKTAKEVIRLLKEVNSQVILTTHDSNLLTNSLLRPDCAYNMTADYKSKDDFVLVPFSSLTQKELREAHNVPKMFRAGAFG